MSKILMQYYQYIEEQKGLKGKTDLAIKTLMPSTKAAIAPDSAENIEKFKKAILEITGKPAPIFQ